MRDTSPQRPLERPSEGTSTGFSPTPLDRTSGQQIAREQSPQQHRDRADRSNGSTEAATWGEMITNGMRSLGRLCNCNWEDAEAPLPEETHPHEGTGLQQPHGRNTMDYGAIRDSRTAGPSAGDTASSWDELQRQTFQRPSDSKSWWDTIRPSKTAEAEIKRRKTQMLQMYNDEAPNILKHVTAFFNRNDELSNLNDDGFKYSTSSGSGIFDADLNTFRHEMISEVSSFKKAIVDQYGNSDKQVYENYLADQGQKLDGRFQAEQQNRPAFRRQQSGMSTTHKEADGIPIERQNPLSHQINHLIVLVTALDKAREGVAKEEFLLNELQVTANKISKLLPPS